MLKRMYTNFCCRFERAEYLTVLGSMNSGEGEYAGKEIGDIYGAEHLCRLLCKHSRPKVFRNLAANFDMNSHSSRTHRADKHGQDLC